MANRLLLIGSGGREHALAWKLAQSPIVEHVFVAPGNAGTRTEIAKISNISLNINDHKTVIDWCQTNSISLVVVGPEDPLANGIADDLTAANIKCFGPSQKASQIEANKAYAKAFMEKYGVPTARWKSFTDSEDAKKHIQSACYNALVIKASGLAAGKGVIVSATKEEAIKAVDSMILDKTLGKAGETIVIEELLTGEEVSVLCFSDGTDIAVMPPAQDHKRLLDGDKGPNTGGMGAYCPCPQVSDGLLNLITRDILQKTINGMKQDGIPYVGVLYAGLMLTDNGPKVLEFNCRFGDPETQAILPLLSSDLYPIMLSCIDGSLKNVMPVWKDKLFAVNVVLVSKGYPGSYSKGKKITGLEKAAKQVEFVFHAGTSCQNGDILTSGGRVLAVVSIKDDLSVAVQQALHGASLIHFEGAFYRKDIASKAVKLSTCGLTYRNSGVDIVRANELVNKIKNCASKTNRPGVMGCIGGFGGVFDLKAAGYNDALLVAGTDGVGTKLKVAFGCNKFNTVGIDLVAMCINDILTQGAEPLFFLDYYACGKLDVKIAENVIAGISEGCKQANCALIGGETAEMPGMYSGEEFDLAGFAVGVVERNKLLPRFDDICQGDNVIGLQSSGIHSNGFSLIRKLMEIQNLKYSDIAPFDKRKTLGEILLTPTKIYVKSLLPVIAKGYINAAAHITGGGLTENIPRILPSNFGVIIDASQWKMPSVFSWISSEGAVSVHEMQETFNCGIGMVLIVNRDNTAATLDLLQRAGENPLLIGSVVHVAEGEPRVKVQNFVLPPPRPLKQKKKVGVLISGSGTNLQCLIDHTLNPSKQSAAQIVLVVSNIPNVEGLKRAEKVHIPTKVISHKHFKSRVEFDMEVHKILVEAEVDIVCLAGFMRILSAEFVQMWKGRLLNIHPALLPSFKGMNAHKQVLEAGVRITGCTVHFVDPEVDAGAIIHQEAVEVKVDDTEETLQTRVKNAEHKIYPEALELLAQEKVFLNNEGKLTWNL